jgi:SAM-dependent methyltransferase
VNDRFQQKPGRFVLDRCRDCSHIFQNPRLSLEGLSFYYADFYDGMGENLIDGIFAGEMREYRSRAGMVAAAARPRRWLDVGAGHGHFCCVAREVLPETRFDGLDFSESIDEAAQRGWIDRGLRGLFPELAPVVAKRGDVYDVVSMSHYLEHTRDPRAEIAAAASVLDKDGLLFVEVPDPECRLGRWFGRRWMPWFQPQHQHFLSAKNLERVLREHAFEPLAWHRGEAHQPNDFTYMTLTTINCIAPRLDLPWRPPSGTLSRVWWHVVWSLALPLLIFAWLLDRALAPLFRRKGWSNSYRVLARRIA